MQYGTIRWAFGEVFGVSLMSAAWTSRTFWSGFLFLLGAALLKLAFYIADGPENPVWIRCLVGAIGACAFGLILQGTLLALLGMRLI